MIHIVYIYLIIASLCFGYAIGDRFKDDSILMKAFLSVFWLPHLIYASLREVVKVALGYDIVVFTLTLMFGYNPFKNDENKKKIIEQVSEKYLDKWQKTRIGRYKIRGYEKLKRLNNL
jgi:hypothetical protein